VSDDFSVSGSFGERDPHLMPRYFFWGHLHLDYDSALKADVARQNFSVAPRYWYVDATMRCDRCGDDFCFSADEQKAWYEDYGFYVDSFAKRCKACRHELRDLKALRQEYDRDIAAALMSEDCEWKLRIATVIDRLCGSDEDLPVKVHENRKVLAKQIARRSRPNET
jgi:hypothetical protein